MRPVPAPRRPDATPMPEGDSRDWVSHPGPEHADRYSLIPCHARQVRLHLPQGVSLLDAVAQAVEAEGAHGACVRLDGVALDQMHYVMPDGPADEHRAAWYSDTHQAQGVTLAQATASVGIREGAWFLHTHASWAAPEPAMGHLLNDQCTLARDCTVDGWVLDGARLEVTADPETQFPLFQPVACGAPAATANAALLTIRPHADLRATLETASAEAGLNDADIHGLGSLIGAGFDGAEPMRSTLSEVVLLDGCRIRDGICTALPLACVDPAGRLYAGDLTKGKGPVLVTFELLVVAA